MVVLQKTDRQGHRAALPAGGEPQGGLRRELRQVRGGKGMGRAGGASPPAAGAAAAPAWGVESS